jgi:hypothetical protein
MIKYEIFLYFLKGSFNGLCPLQNMKISWFFLRFCQRCLIWFCVLFKFFEFLVFGFLFLVMEKVGSLSIQHSTL